MHYNPKDFDFGKKKAFPMRPQHFFASIDKVSPLLDPEVSPCRAPRLAFPAQGMASCMGCCQLAMEG